jgi:hypothetical protein
MYLTVSGSEAQLQAAVSGRGGGWGAASTPVYPSQPPPASVTQPPAAPPVPGPPTPPSH